MKKRSRTPAEPVYTVTGVAQSLQDDQAERMRRYLLSMGIRTVCFLLAVLFLVVLKWTIVGWVMVVGAVLLPYFAVVMANATKARRPGTVGAVVPPTRFDRELGSTSDAPGGPTAGGPTAGGPTTAGGPAGGGPTGGAPGPQGPPYDSRR